MPDPVAIYGLIAALVHDVRKIDLNDQGQWEAHEDLTRVVNSFLRDPPDFSALLSPHVVEIVAAHHNPFSGLTAANLADARSRLRDAMAQDPLSRAKIALALADRWQKAMYGVVQDSPEFGRLTRNPLFVPFWGEPRIWEPGASAERLRRIADALQEDLRAVPGYPPRLSLRRLLAVQEHLAGFPHTTYIPHSPLSVHHRFTAALYLLIYPRLGQVESPLDLDALEFSLLRITPDPLVLFYRMRDVSIVQEGTRRLRQHLSDVLHRPYRSLIPDLSPEANPFEFFGADDLVLLTDRPEEILSALRDFVNTDPAIPSVSVERLHYRLPAGWGLRGKNLEFYAQPEEMEVSFQTLSILGERLTRFSPAAEIRCQRCGAPVQAPFGDEEILCRECASLRQRARGGTDLEKLAGNDLLGFVFLALPDPLRPHARQAAGEKLIPYLEKRRGVSPGLIRPSPFGFLEYLAALEDLARMRRALEEEKDFRECTRAGRATSLFISSTLMAWALRWEDGWRFTARLDGERERLALESSLTVVFARPDFPFWSLMDQYARYRGAGRDIYFDAAGRSLTMFTAKEVNDIRRLAIEARKAGVTNSELESLVQTAMLTDLHELFLEIEARAAERKLGDKLGFPGHLRQALSELDYTGLTPQQQRHKRAVFIKYIRKLKGGQ